MILPALAALALAAEPLLPPPTGYAAVEDAKPPVVALFSKELWDGEATLAVERHDKQDGEPGLEAFVRQLGAPSSPRRRKADGRVFALHEGIPVESVVRRLPEQDPYAQALGSDIPPPRLSVFEKRRFAPGGDAYKLYRCREKGAWGLLRDYRRARELGRGAEYALQRLSGGALVPICFGKALWGRMQRGEAVEDVPEPWMARLRVMARDEWATGAVRRAELETVYVKDTPEAIWAVRYRAPERSYETHQDEFLGFLAGLRLP